MANEHMDVRRPKQKVKRQIKRSNIALDDYMFDRKMQSLYYGAKPKSDDLPLFFKWVRNGFRWTKKEVRALPKTALKLLKKLIIKIKKYPARFLAGTLALCALVIIIVPHLKLSSSKTPAAQPIGSDKKATASRIPLNQSPAFSTILPQGKTAEDVGGFAKVSPAGAPATYAYKDKINNIDILVSEQELPESMKTDTSAQVEKLAIGFNATQSVKTEKVEFFIGTSTSGEQSVITYTKTLLVFLKSSAKISNERWQSYIEDLR